MPRDDNDANRALEMLEQLAATDPLTGLMSRRACGKGIAAEISRAELQRTPLSLILLDINQLIDINQIYGFVAGDGVLREIATVVRRAVRRSDIVARWGSDEFLILLPEADLEQAQHVGERVGRAVATHTIQGIRRVTVASGVSTIDSDFDFAAALRSAYRRLNQAKRNGEADSDPHAAVRELRPRSPNGTDRTSAGVEEPEPERRVEAVRQPGWPLPDR
jgi:diguanylate cyclase (GGDEF)-like protein